VINVDQTTTQDFSLATARGVVNPTSLEFTLQRNQTQTMNLDLSNTGGLPMIWDVKESGGGAALPSRSRQGSKLMRIELSKDERANPGWAGTTHGHAPARGRRCPACSDLVDDRELSDRTWTTRPRSSTARNTRWRFDSNFVITNANVYDPAATRAPIANTPMAREKPDAAVNGLCDRRLGYVGTPTPRPTSTTRARTPGARWPQPEPDSSTGVAVADGKIYCRRLRGRYRTPSAHVLATTLVRQLGQCRPVPDHGLMGVVRRINGNVYCSGGVKADHARQR
jgi:hypothetical protein